MDSLPSSVKSRVADQSFRPNDNASIVRFTLNLETPEFFPLGLLRLRQEAIIASHYFSRKVI